MAEGVLFLSLDSDDIVLPDGLKKKNVINKSALAGLFLCNGKFSVMFLLYKKRSVLDVHSHEDAVVASDRARRESSPR